MQKFLDAYKRLNAEQTRAVDTVEGPVMVIAGPGTGKTEVLTMRIANILRLTDTPPEAILALTFTESGVTSMRKRLVDLIGQDAYKAAITTFHGFANSVIKRYPDKFPEIIGASSITEIDQIDALHEIIDELPLKEMKPFGDRYFYLKSILGSINELKRQGVDPEEFAKLAHEEEKQFEANGDLYYESGPHKGKLKGKYRDERTHIARNKELADVYARYQDALASQRRYDYSDMIMHVMRALERDEDLRLTLQESYLYFLVDEHQDTNDAQNRIIELLASYYENPNLFVVGDEKQAIFRFQGASLENFNYFKTKYKDVSLIALRENYRSTQVILDAAQSIAPRAHALEARSNHKADAIERCALSSPEAEWYFVSEKIKDLLQGGVPAEEIAVLYRDNRDAAPFARVFEKEGIPFMIESDRDVLGDEEVQKLRKILAAIQRFGKEPELFAMLHVDFLGIPPLDMYKLASFARKKKKNAYDIIGSDVLLEEAGIGAREAFIKIFAYLSEWARAARNKGASEAFEQVVRESGFLAHIQNQPSAIEKIENLHSLFSHLKSLIAQKRDYTLHDFFAYLDLLDAQGIAIKNAPAGIVRGRVRMMTAHKSKGMEFAHVFIVNAIDSKWGPRRRPAHITLPRKIYRTLQAVESQLDEDGDERNLFYVAVTRAKRGLCITYGTHTGDGKEQLPAQYLQEIREGILSSPDLAQFEKKFASHREREFAPPVPRTPELKDAKFLNDSFEAQGLSATALNNYLTCPWQYFYRNLVRIPEAPNKHLMYGSAMHEALKHYFDAAAKGEVKDRNYLVRKFEEALARQPIEEGDFEEAREKGIASLGGYYDAYHSSWITNTKNEVRVDGIMLDVHTKILGSLDKIELLDPANRVNVVDYKTGKPKSRNEIEGNTKTSNGDYKRQLVFYKLLLHKEGKYKMESGEIDFVEPGANGKWKKEKFVIEAGEADALVEKILEVSRDIRSLAFWDTFCENKECEYCELRRSLVQ